MTYPLLPGHIDLREAIKRAGSQAQLMGWISSDAISFRLVERNGTSHAIDKHFWVEADLRAILEKGYVDKGLLKGLPQIKLSEFQAAGADSWTQTIPGKHEERRRTRQQSNATNNTQPATPLPSTNKGGRPEIYDWTAMWVEIVMLAREGNLPKDYLALRKQMQQWFQNTIGRAPQDKQMPDFKRLYDRLTDPNA